MSKKSIVAGWQLEWKFGAGRALFAVLLAALLPGAASANGRYPQSVSIHFQPGNSQRIVVGATFGMLLSEDDGASWRWTCEQNIGYGGIFDPTYLVTAPGTIYATTFDGLSITRDKGCTWSYAGGALAGLWASDVTLSETDGAVWVSTSSGGVANDVFVSKNDGVSFTPTGLVHDQAWWKSVRVAPSDPQRVYVTGYEVVTPTGDAGEMQPTPLFYRSDNGGTSWTDMAFSFGTESQFLVLGVSPTNPDVVYGRVNGALKDTLLRSTNGGMSWDPVLTFDGDGADITAFTFLADDQHLIAGTINFGVKLSDDGGDTWHDPTMRPKMACVGRRPSDGALFTCGANWNPDKMAIGRSTDAGQTWNQVFRFIDIDNELSCPAGSGHVDKCAGLWQGIACQFGIGKQDGGPNVADAAVTTPDAAQPITEPKNDCGCSVSLAALLVLAPWPRRRRRRRPPHV